MKTKQVEFQIPEGFFVPEGTEPGEEFDAVCSFRVKGTGTLCLTRLGDTEMPGCKEAKEDAKERPQYGAAKQMMTGDMPAEAEET